jgi:hypothetical protein
MMFHSTSRWVDLRPGMLKLRIRGGLTGTRVEIDKSLPNGPFVWLHPHVPPSLASKVSDDVWLAR